MILELLEYVMSPCLPTARSMGFLASAIQVRARYRRCRMAWAPHIAQTRRAILESVARCPSRRKVVVLGAGLLHDIPLQELSEAFAEVVLVDIVHPLSSRVAAWRFPNVTQICADVTEVMEPLRRAARRYDTPLPHSHPVRFVRDPELDLTVSVNLLSQLSHVPEKYLEKLRNEAAIEAFSRHLIEAHLDYLLRLPGHTALITDVAGRRIARSGGTLEAWDPLCGVSLPPAQDTWQWHLAPSPEFARGIDVFTTVAAYTDWKAAEKILA
jgi:hypothetical protein